MPSAPRALVIRTAGTNCDGEMVRAFSLAGAAPDLVHLDRLIADPARIGAYDIIGFPGGFSYGDDAGAGRVFAVRVREKLWPALRDAAMRAVPMIGVCNGFQVMVQIGLLPGCQVGAWPDTPPEQTVALAQNLRGRFIDDWEPLIPDRRSNCIWTGDLPDDPLLMQLPLAHGEGRFVTARDDLLAALAQSGQVPLRYGRNLNGSAGAVAGLCDPSGRIFGLMPHPDRFLEWMHHPSATRLPQERKRGPAPGLRFFLNAVEAARAVQV